MQAMYVFWGAANVFFGTANLTVWLLKDGDTGNAIVGVGGLLVGGVLLARRLDATSRAE